MSLPSTACGHALVAPARVPEPGRWFRAEAELEGVPVWARLPHDDEDDADVELGWERLRHLEHASIPRAVARDAAEGALLVAAPDGVPLAQLLEHRHDEAFRLTPGTLLDLGWRLADVIVHAHERGRPHGHLSPDVIWLTAAGELVVWGWSPGPEALGSPRWWAPERARGRRTSGDADQWAVGAILAALITGRQPWRGDDPVTEARVGDATHLSGPVLEQWKPLGRLLERTLSSEPRGRFPSVHPVRQALDAMRQRVPQPSDLPQLGALLYARYGEPPAAPALDAEDAPPPPAAFVVPPAPPEPVDLPPVDVEPIEDDAALDPPTSVSAVPPPLDALAGPTLRLPASPSFVDLDPPTDVATSPTRVPLADDDLDDDDELPAGPALHLPPPLSGDPPSLGDIAVAVIEAPAVPPAEPLEWYERVDIRPYAPWAVGLLAVSLVGWWVLVP